MRVIIRENPEEVAKWVAVYIKTRIHKFKPTAERPFVLGLPTGSSPLLTYKYLIKMYKQGELSFKNVVTFNMDEYVGLPRDHPESYHSYMWNNFFKHIHIKPENVHIPDGNAADLDAECKKYEDTIKSVGGIELFLGGIGTDGHMAFNEPGSSLSSRTRVKTLAYETIVANARFFDNDITKVPKMALTVGVKTIMDAREVLIIITGQHKAHALMKCLEEGVNHMYPLSALQMHPCCLIACDDDATGELRVRTVRYFKGLEKVHMTMLGANYHDIFRTLDDQDSKGADKKAPVEAKNAGKSAAAGLEAAAVASAVSAEAASLSSSGGSRKRKPEQEDHQGKKVKEV